MTIKFPNENKVYVQNNRSNVFPKGNIWSSFGIDLQSLLGVMRAAPRFRINVQTNVDLANLGCPVSFKYFGGAFRAVAGARVFNGGATPNTVFTQDATASTPTSCSADTADSEVFNGKYYVTTQTSLVVNGTGGSWGAWSNVDTGLSTGLPHITRYFPQFNRLYYTNGTSVRSIDTNNLVASSGDYFLSLPFGNLITSMEVTSDTIWIGTQSRDVADMNGFVYEWDGISAQATNVYPIKAKTVMAIVINEKTDNPSIMDGNGVLSEFNGQGFAEIGRLPFTPQLPINDSLVSDRFIHPNGLLYTKDDTILALVNNLNFDSGETINENLPSGSWEWSKETNFVHKHPFTYNRLDSTSVRDWGQNRISRVGALFNANIPSSAAGRNGTLLAGATIFTTATVTTNAIFADDSLNTIQKRSYVVTDWFESKEIADSWLTWWVSFRKFLHAEDNIQIKYRIVEEAPVEAAITWVNSSTFTVLNSAVVVSNYWSSGVGGEVEVTRGDGGAAPVHITNAVNNAGTWTVTLEEAVNNSGGVNTATARFQKWVKVPPSETAASPRTWLQFPLNTESSPRVQVKMCFTFVGNDEFYKAMLTSNEDISTK